MNCIFECENLNRWREGLKTGKYKHDYDSDEAIITVAYLTGVTEEEGYVQLPEEKRPNKQNVQTGYLNLLFDVCERQGLDKLWVLSAILRAGSRRDCGQCPFDFSSVQASDVPSQQE